LSRTAAIAEALAVEHGIVAGRTVAKAVGPHGRLASNESVSPGT